MHNGQPVLRSAEGIRPDGGGHGAIALCKTRTTKRCVGIPSLGDRVRVIPGADRVPASARCLSMMRRSTAGLDLRSDAALGRGGWPVPGAKAILRETHGIAATFCMTKVGRRSDQRPAKYNGVRVGDKKRRQVHAGCSVEEVRGCVDRRLLL
jgi:hypothetical protein